MKTKPIHAQQIGRSPTLRREARTSKKRRPLLNPDVFIDAMERISDDTNSYACVALRGARRALGLDIFPPEDLEEAFFREVYQLSGRLSGARGRYTFSGVAEIEGLGNLRADELREIRLLALGFALAMAQDRNAHR